MYWAMAVWTQKESCRAWHKVGITAYWIVLIVFRIETWWGLRRMQDELLSLKMENISSSLHIQLRGRRTECKSSVLRLSTIHKVSCVWKMSATQDLVAPVEPFGGIPTKHSFTSLKCFCQSPFSSSFLSIIESLEQMWRKFLGPLIKQNIQMCIT